MKTKTRLVVILVVAVILIASARPLMTYLMYLQENQKANAIVPPPDEIVGFDSATGGVAGFGAPSNASGAGVPKLGASEAGDLNGDNSDADAR
jgi:hypothetical protein